MKKINQLAAAVAVALSMTATPQVSAEIEFHPNGRGDTLLFPVFNGYIENYFTIMNSHSKFIQGHLRFRGAAWSGELRDFDVILSPGDVFVFRIADIDGDGIWEIDQSLDIKNFQYTGLGGVPGSKPDDPNTNFTCSPFFNTDIKITQCMDPSDKLVPKYATDEVGALSQAVIDYHLNMGYVEFIGEAVLEGLDYNIMEILLGANPGGWQRHQTRMFSGRGTNAWMWSDAENGFALDHGLSDVPNALSGTAFLTIPGVGHGLAYNAEALVNFRTASDTHRIDNYPHSWQCLDSDEDENDKCTKWGVDTEVADTSVILHHENAASAFKAASPAGDYVYGFDKQCTDPNIEEAITGENERCDEARISFNNTWGPTLADGDDYDLTGLRSTDDDGNDDFDSRDVGFHGLNVPNSVAEVEEAIRLGIAKHAPAKAGPQVFTAYYMDGDIFDKSCEGNGSQFPYNKDFCPNPPPQSRAKSPAGATTLSTLTSYYLAFFPTKFYYGELFSEMKSAPDLQVYIKRVVSNLLGLPKPVYLEVWDIFEKTGKVTQGGGINCISPATSEDCAVQGPGAVVFGYELNFLSIRDLKKWIAGGTSVEDFLSGRVVVEYPTSVNDPMTDNVSNYLKSWPGLMYTFEWDGGPTLTNWRPMHRIVYQ